MREPKLKRAPDQPTPEEVRLHNIAHIPYRAWCRHCVRGRGKNSAHERRAQECDNAVETVVMDYCFMGTAEDVDSVLPILVARDYSTGRIHSTVVPGKGAHSWVISDICSFLSLLGYKKIILKTDQENAIKDLKLAIKRAWDGDLIIEHSPVADSQANGVAERAVQSAEGQIRVLKDALEHRLGHGIASRSAVLAWLIRHAGLLLSRYEVGVDGRTAVERSVGKKCNGPSVEFGEKLLFKLQYHTRTNKLDVDWFDGIFLGIKEQTGEYIIGTSHGIVKARTIQRVTFDQRWDYDAVIAITGLPWDTNKQLHSGESEPEIVRAAPVLDTDVPPASEDPALRQVRRGKITRQELIDAGWTVGCPGCDAARRGVRPARNHNETCRKRMENTDLGKRRRAEYERRLGEQEVAINNRDNNTEGFDVDDSMDVDKFREFRERVAKRTSNSASGSDAVMEAAVEPPNSGDSSSSTARLPQSVPPGQAMDTEGGRVKRGRGSMETDAEEMEAEEERIRDVEQLGSVARGLNS